MVGEVARRRFLGERGAVAGKASSAISSNLMPPMGDAVPAKQVAITSWPSPRTSKICAPQ
jgi:hypothetical protein